MKFIDWEGDGNASVDDVLKDFEEYDWSDHQNKPDVRGEYAEHIELIVAYYLYENYSGDAFVVYRDKRDGKVYEVKGSHCSCYGLENQWDPEEVVVKELLARPEYIYEWTDERNKATNSAMREALKSELGA